MPEGILFDHVDSVLGSSAVFDGQSFAEIPSFKHYVLGDLILPGYIHPTFTISLWAKVSSTFLFK